MEEIGEGQERIKEIRQKCEEIESERQKLKQQSMNISKQSDCNLFWNLVKITALFKLMNKDILLSFLRIECFYAPASHISIMDLRYESVEEGFDYDNQKLFFKI
ncbi:hypothetical protein NC651_021123 [Populus alba x Populus x berolinensis]|nr:hypothetical protein NC651_021123 [Populus alba x Populus x berolinensis]